MVKMKFIFIICVFTFCDAFTFKDFADSLAKVSHSIENEFGIQNDQSNDDTTVKSVDQSTQTPSECSERCSKEIAQLRNNITELYMAFLALHAEFSHLSENVNKHEKALKHIEFWAHKKPNLEPHPSQPFHGHPPINVQNHEHHLHRPNQHEQTPDLNTTEHYDVTTDNDQQESRNYEHIHRVKIPFTNLFTNVRKIAKEVSDGLKGQPESETLIPPTVKVFIANPDDGGYQYNYQHRDRGGVHSESGSRHEHHTPEGSSSNEHRVRSFEFSSPFSQTMNAEQFNNQFAKMEHEFKNWFSNMMEQFRKRSHPHGNDNQKPVIDINNDERLRGMEESLTDGEIYATCEVKPNRNITLLDQQDVRGRINMWQRKDNGGPLYMHVKLRGFKIIHTDHPHVREIRETIISPIEEESVDPSAQTQIQHTFSHMHGFHVHEYGNLSRDCQTTGRHYNPEGMNHGGPMDTVKHNGDLGNIRCNENGETDIELTYGHVSLTGPHSIIGRSLVIHGLPDDYGRNPDNPASLSTGNSGVRIACCVIEEVKELPKESDSKSVIGAVASPFLMPKKKRTHRSNRSQYTPLRHRNRHLIHHKYRIPEHLAPYEIIFQRTGRKMVSVE